ncbi:MAG: amino acid-binding protein, partial [Spirochaetes bacterium]|nr:amino acid-binding protein [Spirochaetota bacterium]
PGGLNSVLRPLREAGINIETIYPFINLRGDEAIIIIDVDKIKEAKELLKKQWIKIYGKEIYKI